MADLEYDIKSDGTEDYTTIGGCNAAVAKNIVTSTQTVLIRVHDNLTETTQDLTNGWTANSTYNVTIQANAGAEIEGSFNTTGKAAVSRSGAWASAFNLTADGTLLKGIYFTNSSSNGRYTLDVKLGALDVIVEDCVIDLDTSQDLRALTNTENATEYRKCLFRCVGGQGAYPSSKSAVFRNCGFVESSVGAYSSGGYFELHNCFTMDCSTEYDGSFDSGSSYNAGETATAGDIPGGNSVTGLTSADFEDVSADDYRAKSGGKLDGAGTSQSSYFTVDAFGTTISSWPIGLNEPSGGGTTSVNSGVDLRWSMLEATTSDIDLRWSMVSAVLQDSDLRWSILNSVLQNADLRWSILESIVSDNDLRWSVLNAVLQNADLRWSILNTAQNDADFKWSILEAISNDSDMRWSILGSVLQDADLRWDVQSALSAVQSDVNLQWGILQAITSDAELRWSVVNSVFADSDLRWNIFASVLQDSDLRWSIINSAFSSVDLRWDIDSNLGTVYNDITLAWSLLAEVYNTLTSQWNLLESITSDTDMRWNILNTIANELALNWDLKTAIQAGATLQWNIISATENDIQLRWRIDSDSSFPDIDGTITLHSTSSLFTVDSLTPKTTLH
jgi:hypothetical protein